jgi:hypothetical protein
VNTASPKIGRTNRRCGSALDAWRQFVSASCAPPSLSAAVATSVVTRSRGRAVLDSVLVCGGILLRLSLLAKR